MTEQQTIAIRTSDRGQFKRCRNKWDMTSPFRLDMEFVPGVEPLDFGIAYHAGLETYYDPMRWNDPSRTMVEAETLTSFMTHMSQWRDRLVHVGQWDMQKDRWKELVDLGKGMYEHYFMWAPPADKAAGWTPVRTEIEFQIPITINNLVASPVRDAIMRRLSLSERLSIFKDGQIYYLTDSGWVAVVYEGRIDLLVVDANGDYWIVDHKTAAQFGQTEHLELDQQCGSYTWALWKMLGINVMGVVYSEHRKKVPAEPTELKAGGLSRNKSQGTTVAKYRQKIVELGLDPREYEDFLQVFEGTQQEFFRRNQVFRGAKELEQLELNIIMEAIDMLDDPLIYPNPDRWNCNGCQFRSPCLMRQDGSDWKEYLTESGIYIKRSTLKAEGLL